MAAPTQVNDLSWLIGGPQGSGVDSSANVFARACAAGGLHVFGKREFYSNIMGEHSYFALRAHTNLVRSHIDAVNLLATFEAETLFRHARAVTDDGAIVYDPSLGKTRLSDIPTIEKRLRAELQTYLISHGVGETLDDMLAASKQRGVALVPIPFKDLLEQIADEFQIDQLSKISRVVNMLAVGASFGILRFDFAMMRASLEDVFRAKAKVVSMNAAGAQKAYDLASSLVPEFRYRLERVPRKEPRLFLTGSQATALGKLYAGMRFQTYYPITPASDESEFLEENEILDLNGHGLVPEAETLKEKAASMLVVQTEDEIAAVTMATGAALTGARSATATSGPGDADATRTGRPPIRVARGTRGKPADRPRLRRLRGVRPRRLPLLQLRRTIPNAGHPSRRQGAREQLRDDRPAGPVRPAHRPRARGEREQRLQQGQSLQAVRPRQRAGVGARVARPRGDDLLEHRGRARRDGPHHRGPRPPQCDDGEAIREARPGRAGDPPRCEAQVFRPEGRGHRHCVLGLDERRPPRRPRSPLGRGREDRLPARPPHQPIPEHGGACVPREGEAPQRGRDELRRPARQRRPRAHGGRDDPFRLEVQRPADVEHGTVRGPPVRGEGKSPEEDGVDPWRLSRS